MANQKFLVRFESVVRTIDMAKEKRKIMLNGIDWQCFPGARIAILSANQPEADAFLACVAGVAPVQKGTVTIDAHASWLMGEPEAMLGSLTPRQNAAFLQRIYGSKSKREQQIELICQLSDFEQDFFDKPLRLCNKAMKSRFCLAVSLAFDFDLFFVPKLAAWSYGSSSTRSKRFQAAFESLTFGKALLVSNPQRSFQKAYCNHAIVLEAGSIVLEGDLSMCRSWLNQRQKEQNLKRSGWQEKDLLSA
jgi:capsular polysaccharide transport system ATP-binding protein